MIEKMWESPDCTIPNIATSLAEELHHIKKRSAACYQRR